MVTGIRSSVAALAPDGNSVMIGDTKGVLHHWSLATKAEIRTLRTFEGVGSLRTVEFSPDGKTLVGTYTWMPTPKTESAAAIIWNTTSWIAQTQGGYASAAFSQDGKLLALGGYGKGDIGRHIKLIEPASRKEARDIQLPDIMTLQQYLSQVSGGETSPSAKNLPIATEKMPCLVSALAFSPGWQHACCGVHFGWNCSPGEDGSVEPESGRKTLRHWITHFFPLNCVSHSHLGADNAQMSGSTLI